MLPVTVEPISITRTSARVDGVDLLQEFDRHLTVTGRNRGPCQKAAVAFLNRWPQLDLWADQPLADRLTHSSGTRQFITFLMVNRHLRPGWDWLISTKIARFWRDIIGSPIEADMERFTATALELRYAPIHTHRIGSQSVGRLLIQTGRPLQELRLTDIEAFEQACIEHEKATGKSPHHYRNAIQCAHNVLFHLGVIESAPVLSDVLDDHG